MSKIHQPIKQETQVKEKVDVGQKVIISIAVLSTFTALFNFSILFNTGLQGLAQKMVEKQNSESATILKNLLFNSAKISAYNQDSKNNVQFFLAHDYELNNLAVYISGQQDVNLFAFDIINNSTSTLLLTDIRLIAYVNGGYTTPSSTSIYLFSPGWNYLDGGVYASNLLGSVNLYHYSEGYYVPISSPTTITREGYVNFNISHPLSANNSITLVLRGNVNNSVLFGQYPDLISFDIQDWRRDVYIYNMNNHRIPAGPNNINHSTSPTIYHIINNS